MNFKKLQAMQLELDNSILSAKPQMTAEERFNKTLVSLNVEVAEVANCAEHFKFWEDNKGKVDDKRFKFYGLKRINETNPKPRKMIDNNNSDVITVEQAHKLTLVEEFSDCLHFILSLANQLNEEIDISENEVPGNSKFKEENYLNIQSAILAMRHDSYFESLVFNFFDYIVSLGITTQELEQVYYEKNEENYRRLREGY